MRLLPILGSATLFLSACTEPAPPSPPQPPPEQPPPYVVPAYYRTWFGPTPERWDSLVEQGAIPVPSPHQKSKRGVLDITVPLRNLGLHLPPGAYALMDFRSNLFALHSNYSDHLHLAQSTLTPPLVRGHRLDIQAFRGDNARSEPPRDPTEIPESTPVALSLHTQIMTGQSNSYTTGAASHLESPPPGQPWATLMVDPVVNPSTNLHFTNLSLTGTLPPQTDHAAISFNFACSLTSDLGDWNATQLTLGTETLHLFTRISAQATPPPGSRSGDSPPGAPQPPPPTFSPLPKNHPQRLYRCHFQSTPTTVAEILKASGATEIHREISPPRHEGIFEISPVLKSCGLELPSGAFAFIDIDAGVLHLHSSLSDHQRLTQPPFSWNADVGDQCLTDVIIARYPASADIEDAIRPDLLPPEASVIEELHITTPSNCSWDDAVTEPTTNGGTLTLSTNFEDTTLSGTLSLEIDTPLPPTANLPLSHLTLRTAVGSKIGDWHHLQITFGNHGISVFTRVAAPELTEPSYSSPCFFYVRPPIPPDSSTGSNPPGSD